MSRMRDAGDPVVVVIEDDRDVREALEGLFRSVDLRVEAFASVAAYKEANRPDCAGCMVLDVRLPGQSGLEFQEELARAKVRRPVVFLSGHADVAMCARAMKAGAADFLTKPTRDQDLLDAVHSAISVDARLRRSDDERTRRGVDLASLTRREHEVAAQVVAGLRNKQIAAELGVSEGTVKLHRAQVMRKLKVRSLADLIRMFDLERENGGRL